MQALLKSLWLSLVIGIVLCSCNNNENEIPLIDLSHHSGGRLIHLNELMKNIKVVRLETSPDVLIPAYFQRFVGKENIIIVSRESILQFGIDGRFIRTIAKKGKGPGEFRTIRSFDVNDEESELYLYDYGKRNQLSVYNLITGEFKKPIPLPLNNLMEFSVMKDYIGCLSGVFSTLELFTIDYSGELLDSIPRKTLLKSTGYSSRSDFLERINGELFYMDTFTDTLYVLNGTDKKPICAFHVNVRFDSENFTNGTLPSISVRTGSKMLISNVTFKIEKIGEGGISTWIDGSDLFLWNSDTKELESIKGYYNSFLEMEDENIYFSTNGDIVSLKYSAIDFKEKLAKALENKELSKNSFSVFTKLDQQISDEDNPVFLIGNLAN